MKAVYKRPGLPPEIIEVENTLEALQEKVGGYIETVTLASDACIVCNEEGRLRGMPRNVSFGQTEFVGPILVVGVRGDEFCDLPNANFWWENVRRLYHEQTDL